MELHIRFFILLFCFLEGNINSTPTRNLSIANSQRPADLRRIYRISWQQSKSIVIPTVKIQHIKDMS